MIDNSNKASEEKPIYRKVLHDNDKPTERYFIVCDNGWSEAIFCENMYESDADWLIKVLDRRPFRTYPKD